ncbi:hypothetical protein CJ307_34400, partial [Klebsiella quasipneumoniae]
MERRKDSQLCRYAIISLCAELSAEQNEQLLKKYLKNNFVNKGMIADYSIHDINKNRTRTLCSLCANAKMTGSAKK